MSVLSTIQRQAFTADVKLPPPPGEAIFIGSGGATQSFVVPPGVYSISAVAVGLNSATACKLLRGAAVLLDTTAAIGVGNSGGGNGGAIGSGGAGWRAGGGAGGYSGDGGKGGNGVVSGLFSGTAGSPGAGGGGAGGSGHRGNGTTVTIAGTSGGGVGLFGEGASGAPATVANTPGGNGSVIQPPYVGGGATENAGGNLRYRNNIAVTPGETLTIALGSTVASAPNGPGMRIIWGANRAFPTTNCGPTVPQGQAYIAQQNTTWIVPDGVTSISLAAQQVNGDSAAVSVVAAGVTVLRAMNGARVGSGGGDGGFPGVNGNSGAGGGGAGGYSGNGGNGGAYTVSGDGSWTGAPGTAGSGGGGGGGASASRVKQPVFGGQPASYKYTPSGYGGGVGISGSGIDGGGGSVGNYADGSGGSPDPINGLMGQGSPGQRGGALSWLGTLAVTPGQVLTINAAGGRVRIVWGPGRSYPNNAGNI